MTLAHAGHWLLDAAYIAPLLIVIAVIVRDRRRDRRREDVDPDLPGRD